MTGFDETVPPEINANRDAAAAGANEMDEQRPEHDSTTPALEDDPDPDEASAMAGDDDLQAGRIGADPTRPQAGD